MKRPQVSGPVPPRLVLDQSGLNQNRSEPRLQSRLVRASLSTRLYWSQAGSALSSSRALRSQEGTFWMLPKLFGASCMLESQLVSLKRQVPRGMGRSSKDGRVAALAEMAVWSRDTVMAARIRAKMFVRIVLSAN